METLVLGHKNPDMDAIVSAIAYAAFKTATGAENVRAARCGNTNERIDFALRKFGFAAPDFVPSVRPRVEDVMEREVVSATSDEPVYDAFTRIGEKRFRGLPVLDRDRSCVGLISGFKITEYLFPPRDRIDAAREVYASLKNILETIDGTLLAGPVDTTAKHFVLVVAAMQTDSFERRLGLLDRDNTVLIVGDRRNIQHLAITAGTRALIITGSRTVDEEILELANTRGTAVIGSPHDTATTVLLARSAVRAEQMLHDDFLAVAPETPLEEAQREVALSAQFAFPVLDGNRRLAGILSKSDFLKPVPRQLILVDHNELSQAVDGAGTVPIVEILDHHRIGSPCTDLPIFFLNRPVGSTSTIVATLFLEVGLPIPANLAGLLMCGVISDTLNLTSPTTTAVDRTIMAELSRRAGEDPATLAAEIFSVGSPLGTMTPDQAVTADCKEYAERGERFTVSQIEELSFAPFDAKKPALLQALEAHRTAHRYLFSALLVTDVNTQDSILLVQGAPAFTRLIDYPEAGEHAWRLNGVVSRKKQLLPYLTGLLARGKS
jgi:manganese-dependent inorganic pyrophosphatase